jgi:hypothetical protein
VIGQQALHWRHGGRAIDLVLTVAPHQICGIHDHCRDVGFIDVTKWYRVQLCYGIGVVRACG